MAILGTESKQRIKLDSNTQEEEDEFELNARNKWKKQESEGHGSVYSMRQKKNAPAVDESLISKRIEVVISFEMNDEGTEQAQRWCSGVVERICDGTWVIPGKMRKCWKKGEAVDVFWDAIPDTDPPMPACRDKVALNPNKWNKDGIGAWRIELGEYNYGV